MQKHAVEEGATSMHSVRCCNTILRAASGSESDAEHINNTHYLAFTQLDSTATVPWVVGCQKHVVYASPRLLVRSV